MRRSIQDVPNVICSSSQLIVPMGQKRTVRSFDIASSRFVVNLAVWYTARMCLRPGTSSAVPAWVFFFFFFFWTVVHVHLGVALDFSLCVHVCLMNRFMVGGAFFVMQLLPLSS